MLIQFLENQLGLTKISNHIQLILITPIIYHCIYIFGGKLSSILVPNTYNQYNHHNKSRWNNHVVSFVNSVVLCSLSVPILFNEELGKDRVFSYVPQSGNLYAIACGYFLWDLLMCFAEGLPNPGFVLHATLCLTVYLISYTPFLMYYGPRFLLFELSTPFLNIGWFLAKLNCESGLIYKLNGAVLFSTFFIARICWGYYQSYFFLIDMYNTYPTGPKHLVIILTASNVALNSLNTVWFYKMYRLLQRGLKNANKIEDKKQQ